MMQEPSVIEKIRKSYSYVDLIFGTHNIFKLAELLCCRMMSENRMVVDIWKDTDKIVEELPVDRKYSLSPVSTLCLAVTTSAAIASCRTCADGNAAESRRIL